MASYVQQNRKVRVTTPLGEDVLLLNAFSGTEEISRPFRFQVEMIAENKKKVPFDAMLGEKVTVHLLLPDESTEHHFNGVCVRFAQAGRDENFTIYRAELVPEFQLLARKAQSRIFQRKNVPEILKEVMKGVTVDWKLQGTFEKRDFCVQYRETDFNFASRLMEEEGIFYFFQHEDGKHTMVVANDSVGLPRPPGRDRRSPTRSSRAGRGTRTGSGRGRGRRRRARRSASSGTTRSSCRTSTSRPRSRSSTRSRPGRETHKLKVKGSDAWELYDWPGEYAQRFDGINRSGGEQPGRAAEDLPGQRADGRDPDGRGGDARRHRARREQREALRGGAQAEAQAALLERRRVRPRVRDAPGELRGRLPVRARTRS